MNLSTCSTLPQELHRRRLNLTLANGGLETAHFIVKFYALHGVREVASRTFEVEPRGVTQFNGIQAGIWFPGAIVDNSERV